MILTHAIVIMILKHEFRNALPLVVIMFPHPLGIKQRECASTFPFVDAPG